MKDVRSTGGQAGEGFHHRRGKEQYRTPPPDFKTSSLKRSRILWAEHALGFCRRRFRGAVEECPATPRDLCVGGTGRPRESIRGRTGRARIAIASEGPMR